MFLKESPRYASLEKVKHKGQSSHVVAPNWWLRGNNVAESWVAREAKMA